jgi:phenylacetate-CoA ligase
MIPHIEKQTTAEIKAFQEMKLQEVLQYVSANSVYYQNLFKEHNIDISKINTLEETYIIAIAKKINNTNLSLLSNPPQQYSYENYDWKKN